MKTRSFSTAAASIAIGALFGWLAANCRLSPVLRADAALPTDQFEVRPAVAPGFAVTPGVCSSAGAVLAMAAQERTASTQPDRSVKNPNILVIMGDDIGWFNPSCYHQGMMRYQTPNIDRIAKEGARFTDWYGQNSCTAGRAAFVCGQSPIRTGLVKVGIPGARIGLQKEDPSVADFMKSLGYATGQFGKNHLGDLNRFLPTVHGFDEFFGNLYHLNAEEEPEDPKYPKDPRFKAMFGPRGVLRCIATDVDDPTEQPRWGRVGKQKIENSGALTKKRMETVDEEFLSAALDFIERQHKAGKPWLCYFNSTRMHVWTHLKTASAGKTGQGIYPDGMVEHDGMVGELLKKLDDLGIADNTIVVYTSDNGAEVLSYPDGGNTPFRGEKDTCWEGGFRVPMCIRWPGVIKPGTVVNEFFAHEDLIPTFAAAAGEPDLVEKVKKGYVVGDQTFKVHLDGHNLLPFFKGEAKESPRKNFVYWNDEGQLCAIRVLDLKIHFLIQEHKGWDVWRRQFTSLRIPLVFNLRSDPFERADESMIPFETSNQLYFIAPGYAVVTKWLESFRDFPLRQRPAKSNIDDVVRQFSELPSGKN
jgi:arylsulfatase A-like enzyme